MTRIWIFLLAAVLLPAGLAWSQEPAEPEPEQQTEEAQGPQTLEERVQELEQQLRILGRQGEIDKEAAAEKAKTTASAVAGRDGFSLRSADGAYVLRLRGYTHFDARVFLDDEERPGADTFLLRRIRPIFEGTLAKFLDFRIMPDFAQGQTVLQDGYLEARVSPRFRIRGGKFKPPVSLERLQSATDLLFVERAFPTNLVPNRDLGIQFSGDVGTGGALNYAVGFFNGVPDGGSADVDTNDGKDVAARLFYTAPKESGLRGLGIGIGGSVGDQEGTTAAPGLPAFRTPAQATFFSYRTDGTAAGTVIADGDRTRISPQGYFYRGSFGVLTEYAISSQEVRRGAEAVELEHRAWQVAASWVLTGGEPSFRGVNPKKPFDLAADTWGDFELAARVSRLELDDDTFPTFANPASAAESAESFAIGLNWYLTRNLRWMLDYERTRFEGGSASGDREDESVVFNRFQISF
ncbi:MAG TPA: porin [Thermoanaerobaculia bacterium]|nr:porin [Thermoanaerobaculia bacterium]